MSWRKSTIREHCEITSSKRIFYSEYVESGVPFYRSKEIIEKSKGQEISEPLYISFEQYEDIKKKFSVPERGDLLLTSVGTIGIPYIVKENDYFYFKDGNLTWFKDFDEELSPYFLYYWLMSIEGRGILYNSTIGSSQKALTISALNNIEIPLPPLETQQRIASILSAYDDLIDNNRRQIKLLEEAAQRLYKEWFVDLRFPGHENVKVVDGVPEGWRSIPLSTVISYEIGGGWGEEFAGKNELEAFVVRGTDLAGLTNGSILSVPLRFHAKGNLTPRILQNGDIIFEVSGGSRTEGVARTARITTPLLKRWNKPVMCASFCKIIRPIENISQFLFDHLQYLRKSKQTEKFDKRSASSIINFRWKDFLSQQNMMMPDANILAKYNSMSETMYERTIGLSLQIETAIDARDRLLPKLMSGEIEV